MSRVIRWLLFLCLTALPFEEAGMSNYKELAVRSKDAGVERTKIMTSREMRYSRASIGVRIATFVVGMLTLFQILQTMENWREYSNAEYELRGILRGDSHE